MKRSFLRFAACPACGSGLECSGSEEPVREGTLRCIGCAKQYRISDSIPRFVESDSYADSFSFEWNKFYNVQLDLYNNRRPSSERAFKDHTGLTPKDLEGKLVLDAGVGAGRYSEVVSRWGAEVVGVDLGLAVDAAQKNLASRTNVHLAQADIFQLPFAPESFDVIFSIGVLHHTPDPRAAFQKLVPLLKPGGTIVIWVYGKAMVHAFAGAEWLRKLTTKLPLRMNYLLSTVAIPLHYLSGVPVLGYFIKSFFPCSTHSYWRERWLDTFDYLTPRYQWKFTYPKVFGWFKDAGLEEIELLSTEVAVKGKKPTYANSVHGTRISAHSACGY